MTRWPLAWMATAACLLLAGSNAALGQSTASGPAEAVPVVILAPTQPEASTEPASQFATTAPVPATGPAIAAAATRPVSPDAPLLLNFQDASLRSVLEYLSEAGGLTIIDEARMEGRVTVMSRQPVSVDEGVALLDTILKAKGYAAIRNDRVLRIVTMDQARRDMIPVRSGNDPEHIKTSDRMVTQIIPLRSIDASKVKADLASLIPTSADVTSNAASNTVIITAPESTVRHLVEIIRAIDVQTSEVTTVRVFQLKYANAANAARLVTDVFKQDQTTGQGIAQGGQRQFAFPGGGIIGALTGRGGGGGPGGGDTSTADQRRAAKITASADDRTNALVVSAPQDLMKIIEDVVKQLDSNPAEQQAVFVYRLKNAQAVNLQSVLNNTFGATGGGGSSVAQNQGNRSPFNTAGSISGLSSGSRSGSSGSSSGMRGMGSTVGTTGSRSFSSYGGIGGGRMGLASSLGVANSDLIGQVYVVADADTNSLLVTTASANFDRVRQIIANLDRAVPQVLIKVLIAEVTHDNSLDLGVEFSSMNLDASGKGWQTGTNYIGVSPLPANQGFMFTLKEDNITAAIKALASKSTLDVLSRPYILTSDNQLASILVGQSVPRAGSSQTTAEGTTNTVVVYDDVGIILDVTPHINPQGLVTLDVTPTISALAGDVQISETLKSPIYNKRSAQSRVAIRDGQTIVIGGLMEDRNTTTVDKVPFFGDIPILGLLLQHSVTKKTKTELLIFLTPHVALDPDELKGMSQDEMNGTKITEDAVGKGAFQEHLKGLQRGASSRPASENPQTEMIVPATAPANTKAKNEEDGYGVQSY